VSVSLLLALIIHNIARSDKRADGGRRVWLHEKANEVFVIFPLRLATFWFSSFASRWSPGHNAMHTVHSEDVAGGLWAAAEWMSRVGRDEALKVAGEEILEE
jgi:hypothetical protein